MQESHVVSVMSSQEQRSRELEELRKKHLAKQSSIKNDVPLQPIATMNSWLEQQKQQMDLLKKQQKDAKENLMNYRAKDVDNHDSALKEELKRKQIEAAEILHNYRGNKDVYLAHELRKVSKSSKSPLDGRQADASGPIREDTEFKSIEMIRSKFDISLSNTDSLHNYNNGDSAPEIMQQLRGSSNEGSSSWIMISENDQITNNVSSDSMISIELESTSNNTHGTIQTEHKNTSEEPLLSKVSTKMEKIILHPNESINSQDHHDYPFFMNTDKCGEPILKHQSRKGTASVSFGLVTKIKDRAQIGPYSFGQFASSNGDENKILDKLLMSICHIVDSDLKVEIENQNVKLLLNCLSVQVQNDDSFICRRNMSTIRRYVRIKIPYEVRDVGLNADIQRRIKQTLAASISLLINDLK